MFSQIVFGKNYFVVAAETTEFEEFVCTAPERLATTAF
jgi:hypothetical protein